ncbi:MAG: hypothetical protein K6G22_03310 [Lachnospiraceae bacterium]|nr:hypothetical protein [Lachnospiraceae bacterium]
MKLCKMMIPVLTAFFITGCGNAQIAEPVSEPVSEPVEAVSKKTDEATSPAEEPVSDNSEDLSKEEEPATDPDHAKLYLRKIEELHISNLADRFELVDVNGDGICELAAVSSDETYYHDNVFLYTIKDDKAVLLKSMISGVDGIHLYYSGKENEILYTVTYSGNERFEFYSLEDHELKEKQIYETIYDPDKDATSYKTDNADVSEDEYYKSLKELLDPLNPLTAIDCDGLNETEFAIGDGTFEVKTVGTQPYKEYEQIKEELTAEAGEDVAAIDPDCLEAYKEKINEYYNEHKTEQNDYSTLSFGLIFFDDDDIPELVAGLDGYYVDLYTYKDGKITPILDFWPYGAGGNPGYSYCPGEQMIYNMNSDYAGLIVYDYYMRYNPATGNMDDVNDKEMSLWYFEDVNGNGNPDDAELNDPVYLDDPTYHYGNEQVSEEEYKKHIPEREFLDLCGSMKYEEILDYIDELEGVSRAE